MDTNETLLKDEDDDGRALTPIGRLYVLRLYALAYRPRSALKSLMSHREPLCEVLELKDSTLQRMPVARIRARIAAQIEKLAAQPPGIFSERAAAFAREFGLTPVEEAVLRFAVVAAHHSTLDDLGDAVAGVVRRDHVLLIATALDLPIRAMRAALAPQAMLAASGLLAVKAGWHTFSDRLNLLDGVADGLVSTEGEPGVLGRVLQTVPSSALKLENFAHLQGECALALALLRGALAARAGGVHVLLHGAPGTGKTELARVLAQATAAQAFTVVDEARDGSALDGELRLRRYACLQKLLSFARDGLIVFDEVEEILGSHEQWGWIAGGHAPSARHKAWKNRLLESAATPTIWIANSIRAIDPALLRRFTLVIEVPRPPRSARLAMLARAAGELAADRRVQNAICEARELSAGDIERARRAAELALGEGQSDATDLFLQALALRAGERLRVHTRDAVAALDYRIEWLNTEPCVGELIARLAPRKSGRLCFAGPPGTGKTALARHIAQALDIPLHSKKASDLLSPWVGETESNIAKAFEEARRENACLLLDEADSFLRSRELAQRSWEVTQVNQLLKEIEDFEGVLILCTNHFEVLDAALLRRLDLKVRFGRLDANAARAAFAAAAQTARCSAQAVAEVLAARPLPGGEYALGDLIAAMRQARLRAAAPDVNLLRDCLEAERRLRDAQRGRGIGFAAALG